MSGYSTTGNGSTTRLMYISQKGVNNMITKKTKIYKNEHLLGRIATSFGSKVYITLMQEKHLHKNWDNPKYVKKFIASCEGFLNNKKLTREECIKHVINLLFVWNLLPEEKL